MNPALLAGVLADPDALGPRLVLADQLVERGDPRGEFIALQCVEALDETRRRRAAALQRVHWQAWVGGLSALVDARMVRFVRGFLYSSALRRSPRWVQGRARVDPEHALIREVEVVRDFAPDEVSLVEVLPRLRGLRSLVGLDGDEAVAVLADPPPLVRLGITEVDAAVERALHAVELPLVSLDVEAAGRLPLVVELLGRFPGLQRVAVGHGQLVTWREGLAGRIAEVDVRVPGWRLSMTGDRLQRVDAWPIAELADRVVEPLIDALHGLPLRAFETIHVRGGRAPRPEDVLALQRAARGTPLWLPATWRRVARP